MASAQNNQNDTTLSFCSIISSPRQLHFFVTTTSVVAENTHSDGAPPDLRKHVVIKLRTSTSGSYTLVFTIVFSCLALPLCQPPSPACGARASFLQREVLQRPGRET
jgi:hypothetical protein